MNILVIASDEEWMELSSTTVAVNLIRLNNYSSSDKNDDAVALFNLRDDAAFFDYSSFSKTILINSVDTTLNEINASAKIVRINGWKSFIKRPVWEIAGVVDHNVKSVIEKINRKIVKVPDEPGLLTAKTVAMIINEAYLALGDNISSKKEIDIAMKLGTNYPYGPFEWAEIIGIKNIYTLLQKLSTGDSRYTPANFLIKEALTSI